VKREREDDLKRESAGRARPWHESIRNSSKNNARKGERNAEGTLEGKGRWIIKSRKRGEHWRGLQEGLRGGNGQRTGCYFRTRLWTMGVRKEGKKTGIVKAISLMKGDREKISQKVGT